MHIVEAGFHFQNSASEVYSVQEMILKLLIQYMIEQLQNVFFHKKAYWSSDILLNQIILNRQRYWKSLESQSMATDDKLYNRIRFVTIFLNMIGK